ncbi:MAG: histidine kinase [Bacteroidales bacterium]|nr:MAG: histidine kinase [Bacteroidales bacterium]
MKIGKTTKRVLLHVIYWAFALLFTTLLYGFWIDNTLIILYQNLLVLPIDMSGTYFSLYFLIPKLLIRKRYIWFLTVFIATALAAAVAERLVNYYYIYPLLYPQFDPSNSPIFTTRFFNMSIGVIMIIVTATSIKILKHWYLEQQRIVQLEVQNQASELALLRSQINPHFLFNTLNNIHTLITKDTDKASDALLRLSEIMRYMLYEANCNKVTLAREIEYLKSYIELQKIRLLKDTLVELKVTGNHFEHSIPPMLLISFVENAFKHGDKRNLSIPFTFNLISEEKTIVFKSINPIKKTPDTTYDGDGGIGLKNVQRRLDLVFKDKYSLTTDISDGSYNVQLTLML